jgi:hypothetical protein
VPSVGKLRKVKLRDVWEHEAKDFTPWLAANADVLGDALGLEIEFTQSEQQVGPYAVDIIGKDLTHNSVLIVENQLEKTNHTHLGQLITYAANTDAVTVVWVAKEFTDEHRQAIDYLNELAGDSGTARFYAVQVSAVQIDDSSPAALLELVAQPNEIHASMSSAVKDAVEPSGKAAVYRELWRKYFEAVKQRAPELTKHSSPQGANWQNVNSIKGGWGSIVLVIDKERIPRVEIYIAKRDGGENLELYEYLKGQRAQLEKEFGNPLVWDEQEHLVSRRIMSRRSKPVDLDDVASHDELINWFMGEHTKFKQFVLPRVYEFANSDDE